MFQRDWIEYLVVYLLVGLVDAGIIFGIASLFGGAAPTLLPFLGLTPSLRTPGSVAEVGAWFALYVGIAGAGVFLNAVLMGGVALHGLRRYRQEAVHIDASVRAGLRRFREVFAASLLVNLGVDVLIVAPATVVTIGGLAGNPIILALGLVGFPVALPVAIYLSAALSLYAPVLMVEDSDVLGCLRRSWTLTRNHRGAIFGAQFLLGLLAVVLAAAVSVPIVLLPSFSLRVAALGLMLGVAGSWNVLISSVAYDQIVRPRLEWRYPSIPPYYYPAPYVAPPGPPPSPPPRP